MQGYNKFWLCENEHDNYYTDERCVYDYLQHLNSYHSKIIIPYIKLFYLSYKNSITVSTYSDLAAGLKKLPCFIQNIPQWYQKVRRGGWCTVQMVYTGGG